MYQQSLPPSLAPLPMMAPGSLAPLAPLTTAVQPRTQPANDPTRSLRLRAEARRREEAIPIAEIAEVRFSLMSPEAVDSLAIMEVTSWENSGRDSVRDFRLGPHQEGELCETCSGDLRSCIGHYGKIVIPPLINPLYVTQVIRVLSSVCNHCGSLLLTEMQRQDDRITQLRGPARLKAIQELASKNACTRAPTPGTTSCRGVKPPTYMTARDFKKDGNVHLTSSTKVNKQTIPRIVTNVEVLAILRSISDEDARMMGFTMSHPRDMVMSRILVIPYRVRPDAYSRDRVHADDISTMYSSMAHYVHDYNDQNRSPADRDKALKDLYAVINRFIYNDATEHKHSNHRVVVSITNRINAKTGMVKDQMQGKRVNYSGRTVAVPGSYMRLDEVGLAESACRELTRPVRVSNLNRQELQDRLAQRKVTHITPAFGAFAGNRIKVTARFMEENPDFQLSIGDLVERFYENGDLVLINRQPTLNRQSIMACRVRIIPDRTIATNLSVTTPLNLDYDGDEVNFHAPQTVEAYIEAERLLGMGSSLMNEQTNTNMMGLVYNALHAMYLMTTRLDPIPRDVFDQSLMPMLDRPVGYSFDLDDFYRRLDQRGVPRYSGRALASAPIPAGVFYRGKKVRIEDGIIVAGYLDKSEVGPKGNGNLVAEIYKQVSPQAAVDYLSDAQFIGNEYLAHIGFSIGLQDCIPIVSGRAELDRAIEAAQVQVLALQAQMTGDRIQNQVLERQIERYLDSAKGDSDRLITSSFTPDNSLRSMYDSGAKGTALNAAQISSLVGQQRVNERRIQYGPASRVLPIHRPDDPSPQARGFIEQSYQEGLSLTSSFNHAMGTREPVASTAMSTANTGTLGHKLIKSTENAHISNDGSVRGADGSILQFVYGGDGLNPAELMTVRFDNDPIGQLSFVRLDNLVARINQQFQTGVEAEAGAQAEETE